MTSSCCLPTDLFPSHFPTKALHTFLFSPIRATCPAYLILIDLITLIILVLQIMKLFIRQFSPVPCSSSPQTPYSRTPTACVLQPAQHIAVLSTLCKLTLATDNYNNRHLETDMQSFRTDHLLHHTTPESHKTSCVFTALQHVTTCPVTLCLIFTNDYRKRIIFSFSSIASLARV